MLVLGVNDILKWCQITTGGRRYTCRTKEINGQLCFLFKKACIPWHSSYRTMPKSWWKKAEKSSLSRLKSNIGKELKNE